MPREYKAAFLKSQKCVVVREGESILKAAREAGIDIEYLCTEGTCGTCRGRLVQGEIDYLGEPRALWEEDKAQGVVLLCLATPRSDVVIEEF
ncbi:MAG: 2Fe-2S iron-sulfur cluster-binding protein [Candidatus Methanosuratincola sp.]|jgi:ferredoxin